MTLYDDNISSLTDDALVDLVKAGSEEAFDELTIRYIPLIKIKASLFSKSGVEKEDLFQEGLLALLNSTKNYSQLGGAEFKTYASLCIERRMLSMCKFAKRQKRVYLNNYIPLDDDSSNQSDIQSSLLLNNDPESLLIIKEDFENKKKCIADILSTMEFKVLSLYIDGENYNDISKKLCITTKAVDNALQRIRKKLKNLIY